MLHSYNFWGLVWVVSIIYNYIHLIPAYEKHSLDGVIGNTPGFDAVVFTVGAPLFASADLLISAYKRLRYGKKK